MTRRTFNLALCTGMIALLSVVLSPRRAITYQRTQTCEENGIYACEAGETPRPVAWPVRCVRYRINRRGSQDFDEDGDGRLDGRARTYVRSAFQAWNRPQCSDLQLIEGDLTSQSRAEFDKEAGWSGNTNLVVWRESKWPYMRGHSFALTSVTYDAKRGHIVDADIEINGAETTFAHFESSKVGETQKVDLVNALTHEVGHLVGLDHVDNTEATMYASASAGEIKKRSLHPDDIRGLCAVYSARDPRSVCDDPGDFVPNDPSGRTEPTVCSLHAGQNSLPRLPWSVVLTVCTLFVVRNFRLSDRE